MTASGHAVLPGGQGNTYTNGATGHGMTGIDPRIETGHVKTESFHAVSGSGQKTATAHDVSGHEKKATKTMTVDDTLDLLTTNGKRSESDNDGDVHASYSLVT